MKHITKEMLKIYKPYSDMDWLNYKLVKNDITSHHIIKKEHGGKLVLSNIALLCSISHNYLHIIECKDIETYNAINKMFKYINQQKYEPTLEQREILEYFLRQFEKEHKNDINAKGEKLIKQKYLDRCILTKKTS